MAIKPEDALRAIAAVRGDAICVPTMTTAPAWREIAPDDLSVTCVGFMGGASSLGLGLALARPERRVLVLDGDGSLLMQLGALATNAGAHARNLVHFVFKNGVYHTSGAQAVPGGLAVDFVLTLATNAGAHARNLVHFVFKNGVYHTSGAQAVPGGLAVDFVLMAKGAGYRAACAIGELEALRRRLPALLREEGPLLVELATGLADKTPMTARGGKPFHQQAEDLRAKLLSPR